MFSRRILSLLVVLSLVAQVIVLTDTEENQSNFVEDSSPLQQLPEYGGARAPLEPSDPMMVKDIKEGTGNGPNYPQFTAVGDIIYFRADDGTGYGGELWRSDGTEAGTYMVKDINPGTNSTSITRLNAFGDLLYFGAGTENTGGELWRSDGTEAGTYMVKDINPGSNGSQAFSGGYSYSRCAKSICGAVQQSSGSLIFFVADDGEHGKELWATDGTEEGTYMVKDIRVGDDNADISELIMLGDTVLFEAWDPTPGSNRFRALWKSDGTEEGTVLVRADTDFQWPERLGSIVLFSWASTSMWRTDGTTEGTFEVTDKASGWCNLGCTTVMGNMMYFQGDDGGNSPDEYGSELWKTNGTEEGTVFVAELNPGNNKHGDPYQFVTAGDKIFFRADGYGSDYVYVSDGTANGTMKVGGGVNAPNYLRNPESPYSVNNPYNGFKVVGSNLYLEAWGNPSQVNWKNLWRTDGTDNGTHMYDFGGHYGGTNFQNFGVAGDTLYFDGRIDNGPYADTGTELWKIDNAGATNKFTLAKDEVMNPIILDYSGEGTPTWEVYPDLPAGLSINSANGTITGTPPELSDLAPYTVYANASVTSTPPDSILYYNAGDDDDDDGFWEDIHGNDGYDIAISNLERIEATGNTDLTHAYRFDSSSDSAYIGDDFEDWTGDLTDDSISIEMWFKPSALSDNKILWESGGWDNGNSLVLMDDELTYRLKTSGDNAYVDISITISLDSEFHNAIVVLNKEAQMAYLYYDGELKANASFSGNFDWAGNDNTGIGSEKTNVGGYTNSEQTEYFDGDTTFRGDIAIYRILEAALDSSEVEALYDQFTSYRYQETYNLLIEVVEPDTDGDGYPDSIDDFPFDPSEWLDTDGDGIGNNADTDDDNDGLDDIVEDTNGNGTVDEGETDPLDPDTDDDGYCDGPMSIVDICIAVDAFPTDGTEWIDTDGDGTGNNADLDDDNDGLDDIVEDANGNGTVDEGETDPLDPDTDDDGVCDGPLAVEGVCTIGPDEFPTNATEWLDTDDDGIGNNADLDDDNDGLNDTDEDVNSNGTVDEGETDPLDPDTDDDGYCDGSLAVEGICLAGPDEFPTNATEWFDTDGDGIGNNADLDDDNDGLNDTNEISSDPATDPLKADTDGDGYCDGLIAVEGICEVGPDLFPTDPTDWADNDEDGIGDNADSDDDNDGLDDIVEDANGNGTVDEGETDPLDPDTDDDGVCDGPLAVEGVCTIGPDEFPTNATEWLDTDDDGIGNNADLDDDNDGLNDTDEDVNSNGTVDEGETDPLDPDTDDDGVCDGPLAVEGVCTIGPDAFPTNATEWLDTDDDGIGNNADLDDDNDGFDDGDDVFPTNSAEWLDTDDDGTGDNADLDDDGDTLSDVEEVAKGTDPLLADTDADTIPDNLDPSPTDPDGDYDNDGILDRDEYNPDADGNPADADGDGQNDMLQASVQAGSTNVLQDRTWAENCCLILLLLLLLLIPLLIRKYNNSLIYEPNPVTHVLGDNMPELRMVPSLHEYTRKYIKRTNSDGLRRVRYAISGDQLEGLDIDSNTGIISGYPEKAGTYTYEVVMKHSKGKFKGEVQIEVVEKGKAEEADEALERGRKLLEEIEAEESKAKEEVEPEAREANLAAKEEEVEAKDEAPDPKQAGLDRIAAKAETIDFGIIGTASASDKDNLKLLKGIGPFIEEKLNALGIYKIEQIAKMTSDLEDEVNLAIEFFPGRVKRDEWVNQAKELSK